MIVSVVFFLFPLLLLLLLSWVETRIHPQRPAFTTASRRPGFVAALVPSAPTRTVAVGVGGVRSDERHDGLENSRFPSTPPVLMMMRILDFARQELVELRAQRDDVIGDGMTTPKFDPIVDDDEFVTRFAALEESGLKRGFTLCTWHGNITWQRRPVLCLILTVIG